nr:TetR/AcrR family transcriptional regulator [Variovorax boronicumulans]
MPKSLPPTDMPAWESPLPAPIPDNLRDRLSPVVMEIYSAGDFHRADMRTIAREAGMSFRTIYRYFGDKEALLFWFIQHWLEGLYPAALEPLDGDGELRSKLLRVLTLHLEFYERNPNVGRIIFMTVPLERWMRDPSFGQRNLMRRMLHAITDAQQQGELRSDIDARTVLDAFNAVFNRAFLMWEYRRRSYSLPGQAAPLFSIVWNGVSVSKPAAVGAKRSRNSLAK